MRFAAGACVLGLVVGCQWIGDIGTRELADDDPDASVGGTSGSGDGSAGTAGASGTSGVAGNDAASGGTGGLVFGKQFGDAEDQFVSGMDLLADPSDLVLSGTFHGELDFGSTTTALQADGDGDVFVARFDLTGKPKYSRRIQLADAIATGAPAAFGDLGQVYVVGTALGAISIDGFSATGDTDGDVYVVALDVTGDATGLWTYPAALSQVANHVAAGGDEVVMTGRFDNQLDFGGTASVLLAPNGTESFVAKIDASTGQGIWARKFDKCPQLSLNGVARGSDGSVYVVGDYQDVCSIDSMDIATYGASPDCLVLRLTPAGTVDQLLSFRGNCVANDVALSSNGDVFVTGAIVGKSQVFADMDAFDGDVFVAKLDSTLSAQWARSLPHIGNDSAASVDIGELGDPFVAGLFADGTTVIRLAGSSGLPLDAIAFSTSPNFSKPAPMIRLNLIGDLFLAGNFDHPADFGGGLLTPVGSGAGTSDIFFGKYTP